MAEKVSTLTERMKEDTLAEAIRLLAYTDIKKEQKDAVLGFISGRDVFIALPTGSLIYGCLP